MLKNTFVVVLVSLVFFSCKTNPFTGKKTLNSQKNTSLFPTSFKQYSQFISENKVIKGTKNAQLITQVGERIKIASEKLLKANGYNGYLNDYRWEYNLVDNKAVNAWCMPGGKIVFYTGILPIAENETAIATIMGHEVAHALADHGAQRMTAAKIQHLAGTAIAIGTQVGGATSQNQQLIMQAYGMGTQLGVMLPFSRTHETEADEIGLVLMAIAGYNPEEAPRLWERMKKNSGGNEPAEILSTHPSSDSRIKNLKQLVPNAIAKAKSFGVMSFKPIGEKIN